MVIIFSANGVLVKTENVWIDCGDVKLYGELYIPDKVPADALLICHGMNARGFHLLKIYNQLAEKACENGFVSLVFDFRGVGKSSGKFDYGLGEQKDVECALNYLASRPEVAPNCLFIVGHSLGGAVSLYAIQKEKRVKGLALWSTPKNHDYSVKKFILNTKGRFGLYQFLIFSKIDRLFDVSKLFKLEVYGIKLRLKEIERKLMKLNECNAVSSIHGIPLLIVVGNCDNIVGVDEAETIYKAANEPKFLLIIDGADHVYKGKEHEIIAKTIEWMKQISKKC